MLFEQRQSFSFKSLLIDANQVKKLEILKRQNHGWTDVQRGPLCQGEGRAWAPRRSKPGPGREGTSLRRRQRSQSESLELEGHPPGKEQRREKLQTATQGTSGVLKSSKTRHRNVSGYKCLTLYGQAAMSEHRGSCNSCSSLLQNVQFTGVPPTGLGVWGGARTSGVSQAKAGGTDLVLGQQREAGCHHW